MREMLLYLRQIYSSFETTKVAHQVLYLAADQISLRDQKSQDKVEAAIDLHLWTIYSAFSTRDRSEKSSPLFSCIYRPIDSTFSTGTRRDLSSIYRPINSAFETRLSDLLGSFRELSLYLAADQLSP